MIKFRYLLIVLCSTVVMSACGFNMALSKGQSSVDLTKKSIALLSVKISNQNKPENQLSLLSVFVCPQSDEICSDFHKSEGHYKSEKDRFNEYLLSFELKNGTYYIRSFETFGGVPILTGATAYVDLELKTEIKPNSISYLGHIDVTLRERKDDNEKRAALFPLINAAAVGFSNGTFDVVVEDKYDDDMKLFISEYPVLQNAKVGKSILPQWIRPENRTAK